MSETIKSPRDVLADLVAAQQARANEREECRCRYAEILNRPEPFAGDGEALARCVATLRPTLAEIAAAVSACGPGERIQLESFDAGSLHADLATATRRREYLSEIATHKAELGRLDAAENADIAADQRRQATAPRNPNVIPTQPRPDENRQARQDRIRWLRRRIDDVQRMALAHRAENDRRVFYKLPMA